MYIRNEKGFSFFPAEISPQCTQKSHQTPPAHRIFGKIGSILSAGHNKKLYKNQARRMPLPKAIAGLIPFLWQPHAARTVTGRSVRFPAPFTVYHFPFSSRIFSEVPCVM